MFWHLTGLFVLEIFIAFQVWCAETGCHGSSSFVTVTISLLFRFHAKVVITLTPIFS